MGHTIRVAETASNAGGPSSPASSAATAVVTAAALPPPSNTKLPTITGTTTQGQTLTEQNGSWTNSPTGFAYQWQDCDGAGNGCTAIAGATGQTYVLAAADVGHTVHHLPTPKAAARRSQSFRANAASITRVEKLRRESQPVGYSRPVLLGYARVSTADQNPDH